MNKLLKPMEAAELLQISMTQLYKLVRKGAIEIIPIGITVKRPRYRISQDQLREFTERREHDLR